ncbi:hypothetical protein [Streptomyces sp. NPDC060205]|uniref:hypothetical protein n=1 Tax=Streptomyces sp. NPDC060205 TaxID=3347072 RepID=UPI00365C8035
MGQPVPRRSEPACGPLTFGATSHCLVMENGSVAMTGTSEELSQDPRVRRIYLGL